MNKFEKRLAHIPSRRQQYLSRVVDAQLDRVTGCVFKAVFYLSLLYKCARFPYEMTGARMGRAGTATSTIGYFVKYTSLNVH